MSPNPSGLSRSRHQFQNAFRLAMDSIRGHKLRSFLTLLGVIIGVASVIMVGAAIEGLGVYAEQSTAKAFGSESFLVAQIAATGRLSRREFFDKMKRNKPIRNAGYPRYRRGGRPLLHGSGRPFAQLRGSDRRYRADHALPRRCLAAKPDG